MGRRSASRATAVRQASLERVETWAESLLNGVSGPQRIKLARRIGIELRARQRARIAAQSNPDGTPYEPRRHPRTDGEGRSKRGRIRRQAMFKKLRTPALMKVRATKDAISIGFSGAAGRIARVHQEGEYAEIFRGGPRVRYPVRELLGFSDADLEWLQKTLIEALLPR